MAAGPIGEARTIDLSELGGPGASAVKIGAEATGVIVRSLREHPGDPGYTSEASQVVQGAFERLPVQSPAVQRWPARQWYGAVSASTVLDLIEEHAHRSPTQPSTAVSEDDIRRLFQISEAQRPHPRIARRFTLAFFASLEESRQACESAIARGEHPYGSVWEAHEPARQRVVAVYNAHQERRGKPTYQTSGAPGLSNLTVGFSLNYPLFAALEHVRTADRPDPALCDSSLKVTRDFWLTELNPSPDLEPAPRRPEPLHRRLVQCVDDPGSEAPWSEHLRSEANPSGLMEPYAGASEELHWCAGGKLGRASLTERVTGRSVEDPSGLYIHPLMKRWSEDVLQSLGPDAWRPLEPEKDSLWERELARAVQRSQP